MVTKLPKANRDYKYLLKFCESPQAPMVLVHWLDASFDSHASIWENELPQDYSAGYIDRTIGFLLGVRENSLILGESAGKSPKSENNSKYRHIWDIPLSYVIKIEELEAKNNG